MLIVSKNVRSLIIQNLFVTSSNLTPILLRNYLSNYVFYINIRTKIGKNKIFQLLCDLIKNMYLNRKYLLYPVKRDDVSDYIHICLMSSGCVICVIIINAYGNKS